MRKYGGKDITLRTRVEKTGREMRREWRGRAKEGSGRREGGSGRGEGRGRAAAGLGVENDGVIYFCFALLSSFFCCCLGQNKPVIRRLHKPNPFGGV